MFKNFVNYFNQKVCAAISLIIDFIFSILLIVWKNDPDKTETTNVVDKAVNAFFDLFVFLKEAFCHKKEENKTTEPEKEISLTEKTQNLFNDIEEKKKALGALNKFVRDNINNRDANIKKEVVKAKSLLLKIKEEVQKLAEQINIE